MKLAVFTPLNPARCGVSDYSETLLPLMLQRCEVEVFVDNYESIYSDTRNKLKVRPSTEYQPHNYEATIYHIGNNPFHTYAYNYALKHPGIIVLHEFNLHHLVADATINRANWNQYLEEVNYNGSPADLAYAQQVKRLEVGPDYNGLTMNRRLLERSRAAIVHSQFLVNQIRMSGFSLPVWKIPHGASMPEVDRNHWRTHLGIGKDNPLIGIFGFLKPYKRIPECLRAMKHLIDINPKVRMILVGEEHPDLPIHRLFSQFDLSEYVRYLGHVPIDHFEQLIGTVDICLNLRYPTAGETSGTLLRALGAGRPVVVSEVGAFSDFPDNICFKIPVGDGEVEALTATLIRLVTEPELASTVGKLARKYVATECSWERVANLYISCTRNIIDGRINSHEQTQVPHTSGTTTQVLECSATTGVSNLTRKDTLAVNSDDLPEERFLRDCNNSSAPEINNAKELQLELADYILDIQHHSPQSRKYIEKHLTRLVHTLEITPLGSKELNVLEMGSYMQITPALATKLGYGNVRGSYLGTKGTKQRKRVRLSDDNYFECTIDLFNAEKDLFPYVDEFFSTVLCCELLEHLSDDPMHMMSEINRILKWGGHLVLSTPNICSFRGVSAVLQGYHPGQFHQYTKPNKWGESEPRHSREYTTREIEQLLVAAGFAIGRLETGPYINQQVTEYEWVKDIVKDYDVPFSLRGEVIYAVGRKVTGIQDRYPKEIYSGTEF